MNEDFSPGDKISWRGKPPSQKDEEELGEEFIVEEVRGVPAGEIRRRVLHDQLLSIRANGQIIRSNLSGKPAFFSGAWFDKA